MQQWRKVAYFALLVKDPPLGNVQDIMQFTSTPAFGLQNKKEAEEQAQRELNELFAQAIKQPKVPIGRFLKSLSASDDDLILIWALESQCEDFFMGTHPDIWNNSSSSSCNVELISLDITTSWRFGRLDSRMVHMNPFWHWTSSKIGNHETSCPASRSHSKHKLACNYFIPVVAKHSAW